MSNEKNIKIKQNEVKELAKKMKEAKVILFTDYRGISVENVTDIRKTLRDENAEYSVIKNNITRRALKEAKLDGLDDILVGPTAVIMSSEDYLAPSKAIYKYTTQNKEYKIKAGIIEGEVKTADEIITLAKLPSRDELISMLAGGLLSTISKIAIAVDQVRIKKESETK